MVRFERLKKPENLIILLSLIGMMLTGGYLIFVNPEGSRDNGQASLGSIHPVGKDIRLRGETERAWNNLDSATPVYQNDRIFTGGSSTALVELENQDTFRIEPNSLVKITNNNNKMVFNLTNGSVVGEIKKGQDVTVNSGGKSFQLKSTGGFVRLESKGDKLKVVVLRGQASVQQSPKVAPVQVKANEEAQVTKDKPVQVKHADIALTEPEADEIVWRKSPTVHFSWTGTARNEESTIELSEDSDFTNHVISRNVTGQSTDLKVTDGSYYFWRVRAAKSGTASAVSSFTSYETKAPILAKAPLVESPLDGNGNLQAPAELAWTDPVLSDKYEVQISSDAKFSSIVRVEETTQTQKSVGELKPGEYYWRVVSKHPSRENLTSSAGRLSMREQKSAAPTRVRDLSSEAPPQPPAPPVQAADVAMRENSPATPAPTVTPSPSPLPSATPTPSPTPVVVLTPSPSPSPTPTPSPAATPTPRPKRPPTRSTMNFELYEPGLETDLTPEGFTRAEKPRLSWKSVSGAKIYGLDISLYKDFHSVQIRKNSESPVWFWESAGAGQFYVRVTADQDGQSDTTALLAVRNIFAPPRFAPPEFADDVDQDPKSQTTAHLQWTGHSQAQNYELQLSDHTDFSDPTSQLTTTKEAEVQVPRTGSKYARVREVTMKGWPVSLFSKPIRLKAPELVPQEEQQEKTEEHAEILQAQTFKAKYPRFGLWGGLGASFLQYAETTNVGAGGSATFSDISSTPAYSLGAFARLTDHSSVNFEFQDHQGAIPASSTNTISSTSYDWKTEGFDWEYRFNSHSHYTYYSLVGLQSETIPFLDINKNGTAQLIQNNLQDLSLGAKVEYARNDKFIYEMQLRYQQMLSSASLSNYTFNAQPVLLFDGSLGISRRYDSGMRLGVYWFGQERYLNYSYSKPGSTYSGSQNLFNSTVQFRLGWEFFALPLIPFRRRRKKPVERNLAAKNSKKKNNAA